MSDESSDAQGSASPDGPQTEASEPAPTPPQPPGRLLVAYGSFAIMVAGVTMLFLGMRSTMYVGGFCASGGPYVIRQECPEGAVAAILLGLLATFAGTFGYMANLRTGNLGGVVWPALFLSLCWNFLEFGVAGLPGDGGPAFGWFVCGAFFFVLGGGPWIAAAIVRNPRAVSKFLRRFGIRHALATAAGIGAGVWASGVLA